MLRSPAIKIHIKGVGAVHVLHAQQTLIAIIFKIPLVHLLVSVSFLLGLRAYMNISAPLKSAQIMFVQVCKWIVFVPIMISVKVDCVRKTQPVLMEPCTVWTKMDNRAVQTRIVLQILVQRVHAKRWPLAQHAVILTYVTLMFSNNALMDSANGVLDI